MYEEIRKMNMLGLDERKSKVNHGADDGTCLTAHNDGCMGAWMHGCMDGTGLAMLGMPVCYFFSPCSGFDHMPIASLAAVE